MEVRIRTILLSTFANIATPLDSNQRAITVLIESDSPFEIGDANQTLGSFTSLSLDQVYTNGGKPAHYDLSDIYVTSPTGDMIRIVYTGVSSVD